MMAGTLEYHAVHHWIARQKGKAFCCTNCKNDVSPKGRSRWFQWANLSGLYKRDLSDWTSLCVPCHRAFDKHGNKISKTICKNKHLLVEDNLYFYPNGRRECLTCRR
jgi:hypothetical protein